MKKFTLFFLLLSFSSLVSFAQTDRIFTDFTGSKASLIQTKSSKRTSFPKEFQLFQIDNNALKQKLFSIVDKSTRTTAKISLPNGKGNFESFEIVEASNFTPQLQQQFPEIRSFSGNSVSDRSTTLKISYSPSGMQATIFRTGENVEIVEPYATNNSVYASFVSKRDKGALPWACSTEDHQTFSDLNAKVLNPSNNNLINSSTGELKVMRLAQSCNGEYANYFGAFDASQVGLVLAAFNATIARCNGVFEKDLGIHLNLIPETVNVIFYDPASDPYSANLNQWNAQLQSTLNNVIGASNYDIGHMFGASGGGGNAGCIGCVCNNSNKGSGITSPADGIPEGDNFDIDYVAHEMGHQMGGLHTFSFDSQQMGAASVEVGSGYTIMGYAGIVGGVNAAAHSVDIFHAFTISQIQSNMATKSCPVTTVITPTNATPVVTPLTPYTIPISTPFALTGSATDANASDVLTYCWEQMNPASISSSTGMGSIASPTKTNGPNWLSFAPTTSPTRLFPRLQSILNGASTTSGTINGGNNIAIEALSSVSRNLNFRLTVRDNAPYSSTAPMSVGQTSYENVLITVDASGGPFLITSQNSPVTYNTNSSQTVTWSVNNTTAAPFNAANVKISFSTDGGQTFPNVLAASVPNTGTATVNMPSMGTTTGRIKVEAIGNIFFDINNANITLNVAGPDFSLSATAPASVNCPAPNSITSTITATPSGGFSTNATLTATGNPAGTTVAFAPNPVAQGGTSVMTISGTNTLAPGTYNVTVTGTAGSIVRTTTVSFTVNPTNPTITTQPTNASVCPGANATFTVAASGTVSYQWQVSINGGATWTNIAGATAATYTLTGVTFSMNNNLYHAVVSSQCGLTNSNSATLTVSQPFTITSQPTNANTCNNGNVSFSVGTSTTTNLTYQWQVSTTGCAGTFTDIAGATSSTLSITSAQVSQNGYGYRVVVSGPCAQVITSNCATLTVNTTVTITLQPVSTNQCAGQGVTFSTNAVGTGVAYQWQVSTNGGTSYTNIPGATSATYNIPAVTSSLNNNMYRAFITSTCTPSGTYTNAATLTVNNPVSITSNPIEAFGCIGGNATFTVGATGTGLIYKWQVSTDGGATFTDIAGATSSVLVLSNLGASMNSNLYRAVVQGTPCGLETTTAGLLHVSPPPTVTTSVSTSSITPSDSAVITAIPNPSGSYKYQWYKGNTMVQPFSPVNNIVVRIDQIGNYTVVIRNDTTQCMDTSAVVTITAKPSGTLYIYPSPTDADFTVTYYNDSQVPVARTMMIYDAKGAKVYEKIYAVTEVYEKLKVSLPKAAPGIYFVQLKSHQGKLVASGKVLIR